MPVTSSVGSVRSRPKTRSPVPQQQSRMRPPGRGASSSDRAPAPALVEACGQHAVGEIVSRRDVARTSRARRRPSRSFIAVFDRCFQVSFPSPPPRYSQAQVAVACLCRDGSARCSQLTSTAAVVDQIAQRPRYRRRSLYAPRPRPVRARGSGAARSRRARSARRAARSTTQRAARRRERPARRRTAGLPGRTRRWRIRSTPSRSSSTATLYLDEKNWQRDDLVLREDDATKAAPIATIKHEALAREAQLLRDARRGDGAIVESESFGCCNAVYGALSNVGASRRGAAPVGLRNANCAATTREADSSRKAGERRRARTRLQRLREARRRRRRRVARLGQRHRRPSANAT